MKSSQIFSAFLIATACAEISLVFLAKLGDSMILLDGEINNPHKKSVNESQLAPLPRFTVKNGIASTGTGPYKRVFGVSKTNEIIMCRTAKPLEIRLDNDFRVKDLDAFWCRDRVSKYRDIGYIMKGDHNGKNRTCDPIDIFLMPLAMEDITFLDDDKSKREDSVQQIKLPNISEVGEKLPIYPPVIPVVLRSQQK